MKTGPDTSAGQTAGSGSARNAVEREAPPVDKPAHQTWRRVPAVDMARGTALAAMAVYHFSWDLSFYGLADIPVTSATGWIAFARMIAGSFLALVASAAFARSAE